jgi:hypothetical protein
LKEDFVPGGHAAAGKSGVEELLLDLGEEEDEKVVEVGMELLALDGADDGAEVVHKGGRVKVKEMYRGPGVRTGRRG